MENQLQILLNKLQVIDPTKKAIDPFAPLEIISLELEEGQYYSKSEKQIRKIKFLLNLTTVENELRFDFNHIAVQLIFTDSSTQIYNFPETQSALFFQRDIIEFYSIIIDMGGHIFEVHE